MGLILFYLLSFYLGVLLVRAVLSFVPLFVRDWRPRGVVLVIAEFVYTLTDPPLRSVFRMMLMTPAIASEPYCAAAPS